VALLPTSRGFFFARRKETSGMQPDDEKILKMSKEIIVKFIELGRVSPANFAEHFNSVFWTIKNTAVDAEIPGLKSRALEKEIPEEPESS
jgi:hypothetical protein